ncbi:phosphohydrolase, partial [Pseudoalteromonas ruthenica]
VDPPADTPLSNNTPASGQSGNKGSQAYYVLDVPAGAKTLSFKTSGGSGDVDMYVKHATKPTASSYDCRPYKSGNNETCD